MLYVKIMSGEDMPDTDPYKHYSVVPVTATEVMQFVDNPEYLVWASGPQTNAPNAGPVPCRYLLLVHGPEGGNESHDLSGNAYVMTESGKTIASHGS